MFIFITSNLLIYLDQFRFVYHLFSAFKGSNDNFLNDSDPFDGIFQATISMHLFTFLFTTYSTIHAYCIRCILLTGGLNTIFYNFFSKFIHFFVFKWSHQLFIYSLVPQSLLALSLRKSLQNQGKSLSEINNKPFVHNY